MIPGLFMLWEILRLTVLQFIFEKYKRYLLVHFMSVIVFSSNNHTIQINPTVSPPGKTLTNSATLSKSAPLSRCQKNPSDCLYSMQNYGTCLPSWWGGILECIVIMVETTCASPWLHSLPLQWVPERQAASRLLRMHGDGWHWKPKALSHHYSHCLGDKTKLTSEPSQRNTTQQSRAEHNTTQHNTTQHNTTQHNTTHECQRV